MKLYVLDPDGDVISGSKVLRLADDQTRDPNKRYGSIADDEDGPRMYELSEGHNAQRDRDEAEHVQTIRQSQEKVIRHEAERRAGLVAPLGKREALQLKALQLQDKGREKWTKKEADEWAACMAVLAQVQEIREKEDALILSVPGMTDDEVLALNAKDEKNWG